MLSRVLLWLFAGPAVALLVVWSIGPVGAIPTIVAALFGQAASGPIWARFERRRLLTMLRELRQRPRGSYAVARIRVQPSLAGLAFDVAVRGGSTALLAVLFLAVAR